MTPTKEKTTETTPAAAGAEKAVAPKARKKVKAVRQVPHGCAFIQATYNNTIVTITDLNGNTLAWSSAGNCGFKGPKKATPYAASMIVKTVADRVKDYGVKELNVFVKGVGAGRDSAVRALNANGFQIAALKETTPLPHNGCRAPRPRRV